MKPPSESWRPTHQGPSLHLSDKSLISESIRCVSLVATQTIDQAHNVITADVD